MNFGHIAFRRHQASMPKRQKGASSLEYIMLAAVLVAILVVVSKTDLGGQVAGFFSDIFSFATDQVPE
ncbi:hypothetical protein [Marinobacter lutaoensis]|uniref:hypothetical protein n=1 Tax=Marinobacter lutaoensis TaxID=135739 RepID=UPI00111580FD|nr:hypothetical protein [Marinobacter lutaoensis]